MKKFVGTFLLVFPCYLYAQMPLEGIWQGNIHYEQATVPFSFSVSYFQDKPVITLINADESKKIQGSRIAGDSLFIPMHVFDGTIRARFTSDRMTGRWIKHYRGKEGVAFTAKKDASRFTLPSGKPVIIENRWKVTFQPENALDYPGIALLKQKGSVVTGTIMTGVGDFRYFEGVLDKDSLKISSFDGTHAFLMTGQRTGENTWQGIFHFDESHSEHWTAVYDEQATLGDPFEIIEVEKSTYRPYFDILAAGSGKGVIDESDYFGKVLLIQLFGTWCPNSLDQTNYLVEWYKKYKDSGVEILAVTYEPNYSKEYGNKRITEYKEKLHIPYKVVLGGSMSKGQAALAFPFIDKIHAFPTLIILDKEGYVRYVNSYFNGPATGEYYAEFDPKLTDRVESLLAE